MEIVASFVPIESCVMAALAVSSPVRLPLVDAVADAVLIELALMVPASRPTVISIALFATEVTADVAVASSQVELATLVRADAASKSNPDVASCPMVSVSDPVVDKPYTSATSIPACAVASPRVALAVAAPVSAPDATNDVESEPTVNVVSVTP